MNPARAEQIAPIINDSATIPLDPASEEPLKKSKIATAITKIANTLYSAFKKDIAPSAIFFAIRDIFSSPTSCLETHPLFIKTKIKATIPKRGKKFTINSILVSLVINFLTMLNVVKLM